MKTNLPVTKVEHIVKDDEFIVSETNLKGAITSTNQYFVDIHNDPGYIKELSLESCLKFEF